MVKAPYILDGQAKSGWKAEPGFVYGFIAYAKSGVPIGINVKEKGSSEFLRDKQDPRETSERELAPTAWVTVTKPTPLEVEPVELHRPQAAGRLCALRLSLEIARL